MISFMSGSTGRFLSIFIAAGLIGRRRFRRLQQRGGRFGVRRALGTRGLSKPARPRLREQRHERVQEAQDPPLH